MSEEQNNFHEIEQFFGCYLLCSLNEKFKGQTYIGFTVNPNRRIKQHNAGYAKGGAKRTSGKGPWEMVLIIHGFPNEISALRFEWAWQNPEKSLRLKHLVPKTKQYSFLFKFNVVCEMLRIGPWCRLPLNIRWLKQEYEKEFSINKMPPPHMPIVYGPVTIINSKATTCKNKQDPVQKSPAKTQSEEKCCFVCRIQFDFDKAKNLKCIKCHVECHQVCLAKHFLSNEPESLLPIEGNCPKCRQSLMWGDLIRYRSGCYRDLNSSVINDDVQEDNDVVDTDSD